MTALNLSPCPTVTTAFAIIEAELGTRDLSKVYRQIGPEPVAAASLGQVYRAVLARDGTSVAIKVQRPGVEATVALDLFILRTYSRGLTWLAAFFGRDIDLVSVIDDFGALIYAEMDYTIEAENAHRFQHLYGGLANVSAPSIFPEYSSRRILTMEWVDGMRLTDTARLSACGLQPTALVEALVQCSLHQMLSNGFFHADPHPGNLLVTPDGVLVYIDFGMMSFLAPKQRYAQSSMRIVEPHPHPSTSYPAHLPRIIPRPTGMRSSRRWCTWSTVISRP